MSQSTKKYIQKYTISPRISLPQLTEIALKYKPQLFYNINELSNTLIFKIASEYLISTMKSNNPLPQNIHVNIFHHTEIQKSKSSNTFELKYRENMTTVLFDDDSYDLEAYKLGLFI